MRTAVHVTQNRLAQFFDACKVLRASLIVSVFAFVVLSLPLQTREIYRVLADDFPNQQWQVAFGFLGLLIASGFIWHCGRQATLAAKRRQDCLARQDVEGALLRWLPRLLAASIPLGAALGLYMTIKEAQTTAQLVKSVAGKRDWPELNGIYNLIDVSPTRLWIATLICLGLVVVVLIATIFRTRGMSWKYDEPAKWLVGTETTAFSVVHRRHLRCDVLARAAVARADDRRGGDFRDVPHRARGRPEQPVPPRRPPRLPADLDAR